MFSNVIRPVQSFTKCENKTFHTINFGHPVTVIENKIDPAIPVVSVYNAFYHADLVVKVENQNSKDGRQTAQSETS